jgi:DNA-directed RNA polymerase specialized sigma24 family protein
MPQEGATSLWIRGLKEGDDGAVQQLWRDYFERLVTLARAKLRGVPRRAADEEDAALSAFDSFCRNAREGRFPRLDNRDDLWHLLVTITARKAYDLAERERRQKRGAGQVRNDSALVDPDRGDSEHGWAAIAGTEPSPEFAAQTLEEYRALLARLRDDELRSIAVWKMEGLTNEEIAGRLSCAVPTVERRLRLIRKTWSAQLGAGV